MKKFLISVLIILTLAFPASAEFFSDVIITSPNGIWTDSRAYNTLNDAITAVGANDREVVIVSPQTVTTLTVPSNVRLKFLRDGSITNSGYLNIQTKNIEADNRQIFTGVGNIDFAAGTVVKTGWFSNIESAFALTTNDSITLIVSKPQTITASYSPGNNVHLKWESPGNILTISAGRICGNLKNIEAGNYQIFAGDGDFDFLDGTRLKLSWFARLRSVLTWVENEEVTIVIDGTHIVDLDDTVAINEVLDFSSERGILSINLGTTLTINSSFESIEWPFVGAGSVFFAKIAANPAQEAGYLLASGLAVMSLPTTGLIKNNQANLNLGKGLSFLGINDAGEHICIGGIITKMRTDTDGLETSDMYFTIANGGDQYAPIKMTGNGGIFIAPLIGGFADQPAQLDALAGIFGERLGVLGSDGNAALIGLRNARPNANVVADGTDAESTNTGRPGSAQGLTIGTKNTNDDEVAFGAYWALPCIATVAGTSGEIDTRAIGRTDGSERSLISISPVQGSVGTTAIFSHMHVEGDPDSTSAYVVPWLYRYKRKMYATGNANITLTVRHSAGVVSNNGAKVAGRSIRLPNHAWIGNGYIQRVYQGGLQLNSTTYKWTASGSEYYVELAAGGDPSISEPTQVYELYSRRLTRGTLGSLNIGEWDYGTTGAFDTIFVRLTTDVDPDTVDETVQASYSLNVFTDTTNPNTAGIAVPGSLQSTSVNTDGLLGTTASFVWDKQLNIWHMEAITGVWGDSAARIGPIDRVFRRTVPLSNAQLKALTTAVELIPAPGAGYLIEVISAALFLNYSGGALAEPTAPDDLALEYNNGTGTQIATWDTTGWITAGADAMEIVNAGSVGGGAAAIASATNVNKNVAIINTGGNYTGVGSTSTAVVNITYRIHETGLQ